MSTKIVMPQLGESVAEGIIGKWLKKQGDAIAKDEPIVEVVTDKVNAEIPSPVAGILEKITVEEGATVPVGSEIALIGSGEGSSETIAEETTSSSESAAPSTSATPAVRELAPASTSAVSSTPPSHAANGNSNRRVVRSSPLVQRMAAENNIDLSLINGTGIGGRVSKKDVLQYLEGGVRVSPAQATSSELPMPAPTHGITSRDLGPNEEIVPISPVRRLIAEHMVRSKFTIPHATTMIEIDMTNVVRYRDANKGAWQQREGIALSFMAFVAQATVEALAKYPLVNSEWGGDKIIVKRNINLGLAVAAQDGLIVPSIKHADRLSLGGLAHAVADLTERARTRRLTPDDVSGGTFTLNNTGAIGSVWSISIINFPQAGILSADAIVKRVRVMADDSIAVRSMMNLSMSFDHRILDGSTVSDFMQSIKRRLEGWPADAPLR